jgi:hypothetical protein
MIYDLPKVVIAVGTIVAVTEVAKRSLRVATRTASPPFTSLLATAGLSYESGSNVKGVSVTMQIFWPVIRMVCNSGVYV